MTGRYPARVLGYVAGVLLLALAAAALAARLDRNSAAPAALLALLAGVLCLAEWLQIRYSHADHVDALTLVESALAPVLLLCSGAQASLVVAVGIGAATLLRRSALVKATFNVAQWVLGTAVAQVVLVAAGGLRPNLAALALAIGAASAVNQLAFAGVMWCAQGHALGGGSAAVLRSIALGRIFGLGANLSLGLLLAAAARAEPVTVVLAAPVLILLHAAARSYAIVQVDRRRLAGLRAATSAIGAEIDPDRALPILLREVLTAFDVRSVELALPGDSAGWLVRRVQLGAGRTAYSVDSPAADRWLDLLAAGTEPVRWRVDRGDPRMRRWLAAAGHRSCLTVPVRGRTTGGVLCLYDRRGLQGFEDGEPAIAAALAADVADLLDRSALYASLAEERRQLAEIVETTSDGILAVAADGTVQSWNASFAAITGHPAAAVLGRAALPELDLRDGHGHSVALQDWARSAELPADLRIRTAAGGWRWLSCSYGRAPGADGGRLVVVARDVTRARELERLKDDFLAVVSHELRSPLVPIKGWAKTLLQRGGQLRPDQHEAGLRAILGEAHRLEQLVLNILQTAQVDLADSTELVELADVAHSVVAEVKAAQPGRAVRVLAGSGPLRVAGPAGWLERIVANLVHNAVKYAPDREPVTLRLERDGRSVWLRVTDHGPGIPVEAQRRIFDRFERLAGGATQPGTGLGLYLARRLAVALGGDLTVASRPGAGATFSLRLPAAGAGVAAATAGARLVTGAAGIGVASSPGGGKPQACRLPTPN